MTVLEVSRVLVVVAVLCLFASLFLPWIYVDISVVRSRLSLRDADTLVKALEQAYGKGRSSLSSTVNPFSGMMTYIVIMIVFMVIGVFDSF